MPSDEKPWKPTRKWRRHLYYKVQVFDAVSMTWRDEKPAFDKKEEALRYVRENFGGDENVRLMAVDGRDRTPVEL